MKIKILLSLVFASFSVASYATTYKIKHSAVGMVSKKDYKEQSESIVFRHIDHDTHGWADIVIAKLQSDQLIDSEKSYRDAAISTGFDSYYTLPNDFRCKSQVYGPAVVPAIDYGCNLSPSNLQKYILIKKPDDIVDIPNYLIRAFDQKYWRHGAGTWLMDGGIKKITLNVGVTSLANLQSIAEYKRVTASLVSGDWIMVADPKTNRR